MDHRKFPRKAPKSPVENNVTYQTVSEQPVITGLGSLVDISENGCRIGGKHALRNGLRIQLALQPDTGQSSTILMDGKVAWVKENEFGVEFLW